MLRDRIICGIKDDAIQQRLLSEKELTFKKALEIAQTIEAATHHMKELHTSNKSEATTSSIDVYKVMPVQGLPQMACYHCGKRGHRPSDCHFKDVTCHYCGKVGHLMSVCLSRRNNVSSKQGKNLSGRVDVLQEEDLEEHVLNAVDSSSSIPPNQSISLLRGVTGRDGIEYGCCIFCDARKQVWSIISPRNSYHLQTSVYVHTQEIQ